MTYFAFSLPNRPGELARLTEHLRAGGINLLGLWGYAHGEEAPRLSCVPENPDAFERFAETSGLDFEMGDAFYTSGADRAGALFDTLRRISDAGINVDAIEAVAADGSFGCFIWADEEGWSRLEDLIGA